MTATMTLRDAETNFPGVLFEVEKNFSTFTITHSGRPVARIVPALRKRNLDPLPEFVEKVKMHGDWFADDSSDWENA